MRTMLKSSRFTHLMAVSLLLVAIAIPTASAMESQAITAMAPHASAGKPRPEPSGIYDLRDLDVGAAQQPSILGGEGLLHSGGGGSPAATGINITECPQAGLKGKAQPLDLRAKDTVERLSDRGDDIRINQDYSCFPQNETSIDVNPRENRNIVVGANDYRLGTGSSGFYATTDGGQSWYDGIIPFPSAPAAQSRGEGILISGGDPVIAFDRAGIVYYSMIAFFRGDDTNGLFASRSTNGGFTWSRSCVPSGTTDANAFCVAAGLDVRKPGDGRVNNYADNNNAPDGSVPFNDKEWMTTGPRPTGVTPVCFTPITRVPTPCDPATIGVDRIYITWSLFDDQGSRIFFSFSDDQSRSWSPPKPISGSAPFCIGSPGNGCNFNQGSVPTVNPTTGHLYVAWLNGNTPDEDQYLMVRSTDGGNTFTGPFFITPIYDLNFPRAGATRPDCTARGQQANRIVYTNSCFRSNPYGNIVADKRGGAFANDLYVVISDNRNGTSASSNADVFLFKSTNGGATWIGPTRVNDDRSVPPPNRDCGRVPGSLPSGDVVTPCGGVIDYGNDQWWPWVDIGKDGELNITFHDRRLDTNSVAHEWGSPSRSRPGNYLVWQWGAQCRVKNANSRECLAPGAAIIPQPVAPIDPGADPVPGQGAAYLGTLKNFQISDVPSNFDYSFRAGIFAGDYENVVVEGDRAYATWTDARNGRSSRNQPGRNPICEQSDVFMASYEAKDAGSGGSSVSLTPFLVRPCPSAK
jgi:hypothetical protein